MKTLVTYLSDTGNTKKVADAIFQGIDGDKEIMPIDQVKSIEGYNISFLGFPVKKMGPDKNTIHFLKEHCIFGRNVVLFITHAAPEDSPDLAPMLEKFRHAARGANIIDLFDCQGQLSKTVKFIMSIVPNAQLRTWAKQDNSQGQPNRMRLDRATAFSKDVMERFNAEMRSKNDRVAVPA